MVEEMGRECKGERAPGSREHGTVCGSFHLSLLPASHNSCHGSEARTPADSSPGTKSLSGGFGSLVCTNEAG